MSVLMFGQPLGIPAVGLAGSAIVSCKCEPVNRIIGGKPPGYRLPHERMKPESVNQDYRYWFASGIRIAHER